MKTSIYKILVPVPSKSQADQFTQRGGKKGGTL